MAVGMIDRGPFFKVECGHEMGRRVGRTADPNAKLGGRRAGGRPKRTKSGQMRRPFGSARWSCSKELEDGPNI